MSLKKKSNKKKEKENNHNQLSLTCDPGYETVINLKNANQTKL